MSQHSAVAALPYRGVAASAPALSGPVRADPRAACAVSVVICAYTMDRWDDVVRAIESVRMQTVPALEVILVADYNDELAELARMTFPEVRVIGNAETRGLSGARNTGVRAARGDIIAFLDDDAAAVGTWLQDLTSHYDDPTVYGVGGSATAVWTGGPRPRWMPPEFDWVVGCSYLGQPTTVAPVRNFIGCNMSFRREVFDLVGGFSSAIGRVGKRPLGCEETELCIRVGQAVPGAKLLYDPAVNVHHRVSPDRRRFRYFRSRCYSEGLSKAMVSELVGADSGLASERSYVQRVLPKGFLLGLLQLLLMRPFGVGRSFAIAFGLLATSFGYARGRREIVRRNAGDGPPGPSASPSARGTAPVSHHPARGTAPVSHHPARGTAQEKASPASRMMLGLLVAAVGTSLLMQGLAVTASRSGAFGLGLFLYFTAVVLPFAVGVMNLLQPGISARARRWVVLMLGLVPTVIYRLTDPFLLTGFDEQLHLRTLNDLLHGAPLSSANPVLPTSPSYPGLELLTLAIERATHLPTMAAITVVVLMCRVILVLAIYQLAVVVVGNQRSASLAVVFYAASPQFYFFNSQYAYQTLALSLAVGGLLLLSRAVQAPTSRRRLTFAALLCFAGVTVTHHLTSWVVTGALVVWAALAPRQDRRLLTVVAGATAGLVIGWAIPIAHRLGGYLGPVFADALGQVTNLAGGRSQRVVFSDSAGASTPMWERVLLVLYAVTCTLVAAAAGLILLRRALRGRNPMLAALGALCLAYPMTYVARLAPKASEISDRATTFTFLPLAVGVALLIGAWASRARHRASQPSRLPAVGAVVVVMVSSLGYLGGLVLGSGPDWGRLPGSYLVVADSRSLDPETLAAAAWSRDHLKPGDTIMADRVPATLLASTARMWIDSQPRKGVEPATLYFSQTWGPEQTTTAQAMGLQYLYVDSRLSDTLPHQRWYFYPGETPDRSQLTAPALAKFAAVPGITTAYRHGPVAIYDLRGLQVDARSHGWVGTWRMHPWRDGALGLLAGVLLAWRWAAVRRRIARTATVLGAVGSTCVAMATTIMLTGLATAVGFRPGWPFFAALVAPVIATIPLRRTRTTSDDTTGIRWSVPRPSVGMLAVAVVATACAIIGVGLALRSAWIADVVDVAKVLAAAQGSRG